jgi:thiamine biosynthesis lipoprotein
MLQRFQAVEPHMGTLVGITLYARDVDTARKGFTRAFARVHELDAKLSDYQPDSELNQACRAAAQKPVPVTEDLYRVLEAARQIARDTDGAFDVTVGPLTQLWRQTRKTKKLPTPEVLKAAQRRCGYRKITLNPHNKTLQLSEPNMQLDLGGIAKGFIADEARLTLAQNGFPIAMIAASGDLALGDPPPGTDGWQIALLAGPTHVSLRNCSASTAGDTEQFVEIEGHRYSHILDPRTGLGLTSDIIVSVIAKSGLRADGLDTAIAVLGPEKGLEYLNRQPDATGVIEINGTPIRSKRFPI